MPGGRLSCGERKVGQSSAAWNLLLYGCCWSLLPGSRCAEPAGTRHRALRAAAWDVPLVLSRPLAAEQGVLKGWEGNGGGNAVTLLLLARLCEVCGALPAGACHSGKTPSCWGC